MASRGILDEHTLTRRDFFPSEADLYTIKQQIAVTEREILELQQRQAERTRFLHKLRCASSTIRRLPLELLSQIFWWLFELHQEEDPSSDQITLPWEAGKRPWQFNLLQVCFAWRQAALNSSFLWSNFMIIAPEGDDDDDDDKDEDDDDNDDDEDDNDDDDEDDNDDDDNLSWSGEEEWVDRLTRALDLFPPNNHLVVGIDLENTDWNFLDAARLAVEHVCDPLLASGRSITVSFRGYYPQATCMFTSIKFKHPQLLDHIIIRDLGSHEEVDELNAHGLEALKTEEKREWLKTARNIRRLEFIGENMDSVMLERAVKSHADFPWGQLTHLVFHALDYDQDAHEEAFSPVKLLDLLQACKKLVHLTLVIRLWDDDEDDDGMRIEIRPDQAMTLLFLRSLIVNLGMARFFQYLNLPSLSSLEVRNDFYQYLPEDISALVVRSQCSIESFIDTIKNQRSGCLVNEQANLEELLERIYRTRVFKTWAVLPSDIIKYIASGRRLPLVEVLEFCSQVPFTAESVIETLKPRFVNIPGTVRRPGCSSLKELTNIFADCGGSCGYSKSSFYVGGTFVRVVHDPFQPWRKIATK